MYGVFAYIYNKNQLDVGKYIIPYMDPMGYNLPMNRCNWGFYLPWLSKNQNLGDPPVMHGNPAILICS